MKSSILYTLILWLSCCSIFCSTAFARSYDDIIESNEITVAVYSDFIPFSYQENGEPKGIDIEVAKHIAKALGVTLRFRWVTADENVEDDLRNNLWKGHYLKRTIADLMLRVPYDTKYTQLRDDLGERVHQQVHMFAPYHTESWKIIFNTKKIEEVTTMAIFQYHNIGVEVDSIPQFYLISAFNGRMRNKTKQFSSLALAISAMDENKVDAVMGLRSQVSHYQHKLASPSYQLAKNAFPMIGTQQWDIGMAVKSDYRQLGYAVGDIVNDMVKQGVMEKIFLQYNAIYQMPELYSVSK
ncbi:substrate-binding periplasmic protein [Colwellia ponticola]|uniref:Transporter substrate-binding domain-containing protein n=1 Tax=Colwellia ponticola TaxID=2304625 RepID=A0A8H2PP33_9GAMM|nr:transporter substrate-binding domain-containing protein [Colwellia ponticola]RGP39644.1 Prephenate dehydratase [Altererythrobacter insulae]TMM47610.1 transporter substrate-binding domain-containing protein [Colwellia ponticola]